MSEVNTAELSEAMAELLRPAVGAVAAGMPVVAGIEADRAAESHVMVSEGDYEELVPGTFFYRVEGEVQVRLLGSGAEPAELRALRRSLLGAVNERLLGVFASGSVELDEAGCPATVRSFATEFLPMAVEDGYYTAGLSWRAYVQF